MRDNFVRVGINYYTIVRALIRNKQIRLLFVVSRLCVRTYFALLYSSMCQRHEYAFIFVFLSYFRLRHYCSVRFSFSVRPVPALLSIRFTFYAIASKRHIRFAVNATTALIK